MKKYQNISWSEVNSTSKRCCQTLFRARLGNVVTTLVQRCYNVATTSVLSVATTLSTNVGETLISNELTTSIHFFKPGVVTTLCFLGRVLTRHNDKEENKIRIELFFNKPFSRGYIFFFLYFHVTQWGLKLDKYEVTPMVFHETL